MLAEQHVRPSKALEEYKPRCSGSSNDSSSMNATYLAQAQPQVHVSLHCYPALSLLGQVYYLPLGLAKARWAAARTSAASSKRQQLICSAYGAKSSGARRVSRSSALATISGLASLMSGEARGATSARSTGTSTPSVYSAESTAVCVSTMQPATSCMCDARRSGAVWAGFS